MVRRGLGAALRPPARGLLLESLLFEAPFRAGKDYLPPLLALAAGTLPALRGGARPRGPERNS